MIALVDAIEGLAVSLGGCAVISVFRAARMLDDDRAEEIANASNEVAAKQSIIVRLQSDIEAAKVKPKVPAFEQAQRDAVVEKLKDWTEDEKRILEHVLQHESQDRGDLVRFCGNLIPADAAMNKGKVAGVIQFFSPHGSHVHYRVTPSFVEALKFYFHGE